MGNIFDGFLSCKKRLVNRIREIIVGSKRKIFYFMNRMWIQAFEVDA